MTVTDEDVRAGLRAAMDDAASAPPLPPTWDRVERGLRKVRRRRRLVRAGKVTGGLVVVAAALAAVQTNAVPYPSWATVTIPAASGSSRLADDPVRGSLAGDTAWLDDLRRAVAAGETSHESGGEAWAPPSAGGVHVIYAGDVGGVRVALVEGDWHWGVIAAPQQVWYSGSRGAAAADLEQGSNADPADIATFTRGATSWSGDTRPQAGEAVVVVVADRPLDVRLRTPPRYSAEGTVSQDLRPLPQAHGAYEAVITEPGTFELVVPGGDWDEPLNAVAVPELPGAVTAGFGPPARGGATPPADELAAEELYSLLSADLPAAGTPRRLLWAGQLDGRRYRVAAVTAPSGAHVLAVFQHNFSGENLATVTIAGAVLPRGPLDEAGIAWRLPVGQAGTDPGAPRPAATVAAVGPEGTRRAVFLDDEGRPLATVPRTAAGVSQAEAASAVAVRFEDARGRDLGTVVVRPLLSFDERIYGK